MAVTESANPFFDLTPRTKLRIAGGDRVRYLNGQLTNDVGRVKPTAGIAACVLNAKGRMENFVFVSDGGDSYFIDAERDLSGKLQARLERYVIADDVQIDDVSARFSIFHVLGSDKPDLPGGCGLFTVSRFRQPGYDVWVENSERDAVFGKLTEAFRFCDDSAAEVLRIEQGIPRWGRELTEEVSPPEADLEQAAIDYDKGCYIGQEVISRMKMSGQRNKKLCGFISINKTPLETGMKLFPIGDETKEVGWISSATNSKKLGQEIALGFIRRPFHPASFKLDAINPENPLVSGPVRVEIAELPFIS